MTLNFSGIMKLVEKIEKLKRSEIKKTIDSRIKEFKRIGNGNKIFEELCFCVLTANFNAERSIKIQREIGSGFLSLSEEALGKRLKELGHRYPNTRAHYICENRKLKNSLKNILKSLKGEELREWLVKNIKGFGYKEASHFLRNIGFEDFAIIDFHIIDLLVKNKIIKKPKTLGKKKYLEIEETLRKIAKKTKLTLGELDFYLWYMETGKVLK